MTTLMSSLVGFSYLENDFIRKMEATTDESTLVVLDSDFLTFNLYNLKKQERFKSTEYKNE